MDLLEEMQGKRHKLARDARAILDKAEADGGELKPEMRTDFDRIAGELDELDADIARHQRAKALGDAEHVEQTDEQRAADAKADRDRIDEHRRRNGGETGDIAGLGSERAIADALNEYRKLTYGGVPQNADEFRGAFFKYMTATSGELRAMGADEFRVLSTATNPGGGYIVPATFERTLIEYARDFGVMRQLASVQTTATGEKITQPAEDTHGVATWLATNAAYAESDETFAVVTLDAFKAGTLMRVAEELLQDASFDLEAYIARQYAARIGILENTAYVAGDGVGKPTGVVTSAPVGRTQPAGNTATLANGDELVRLYHSVIQAYRNRGSWLMKDATAMSVRLLKDGQGQYIWRPGLTEGAPDVLLGRPVYTDPDMPAMAANAKAVLFGDFSYYVIRDVQGVGIQRLVELFAGNGQVGFRGYHRTEGKLVNTNAVKALANSAV